MARLRLVTLQDTEELLQIYAPYITDTAVSFEYEVPSVDAYRARIEEICAHYPYLVLEEDGRLLGYAYAHRQMDRAAYQWNTELSVYLRPEVTGRGLGTALYSALLELLRLQGFKTAYGCVAIPNVASEALHEKLGFHPAGVWSLTGYKNGQWQNVGWFEKQLAPYDPDPVPPTPITQMPEDAIRAVLSQYER